MSDEIEVAVPSITFLASLAGVNTAARPISFDIDGAAKVSLETPESEQYNVVALSALKRSLLKVTVQVIGDATPVKRGRKKKNAVVEAD